MTYRLIVVLALAWAVPMGYQLSAQERGMTISPETARPSKTIIESLRVLDNKVGTADMKPAEKRELFQAINNHVNELNAAYLYEVHHGTSTAAEAGEQLSLAFFYQYFALKIFGMPQAAAHSLELGNRFCRGTYRGLSYRITRVWALSAAKQHQALPELCREIAADPLFLTGKGFDFGHHLSALSLAATTCDKELNDLPSYFDFSKQYFDALLVYPVLIAETDLGRLNRLEQLLKRENRYESSAIELASYWKAVSEQLAAREELSDEARSLANIEQLRSYSTGDPEAIAARDQQTYAENFLATTRGEH